MQSIQLSLRKGGWININPKADTSPKFLKIIDNLKKIPVICYDKKLKRQYTSIYYLDKIYDICREYGYDVLVSENLEEYHQRFLAKQEHIKEQFNNTEFHSDLWTDDQNFKIRPYQAKAINVLLAAKRYLESDDMGLGKSAILIATICKAFEMDYNRALIIVNNRLKYQWVSEIIKFTKILRSDISVLDTSSKFECPLKITDKLDLRNSPCKFCERKEKCVEERHDPDLKWRKQLSEGRIVIANYEALEKIKNAVVNVKQMFDFVGFDEATRLKNWKSTMAKAAFFISKNLPSNSFVIPMSGTFIENRLEEIYPPFNIIDKRILGETYNFKNNYLITDYWNKIIGVRNPKRLKKIIKGSMIRRTIDEVWTERPPLIEITKICDMTSKQREFYNETKLGVLKNLADKEAEGKINMAQIGALLNYLLQVSDTTETLDPTLKESGKIDTLLDMIKDEIDPTYKMIIFSFFGNKVVPIIEREITKLKMGDCVVITGKTKQPEGEKRKERFMTDPKCRFMICSDAMSYGANLQCARYVVNFDLRWNPATIAQRIRRAYRMGQTKSVTVLNFVSPDSIEEMILEALGTKTKLFNDFIGDGQSKPAKKKITMGDMIKMLKSGK